MRPNDQIRVEPVAQRPVLHGGCVLFHRGMRGLRGQPHFHRDSTYQVRLKINRASEARTHNYFFQGYEETLVQSNADRIGFLRPVLHPMRCSGPHYAHL